MSGNNDVMQAAAELKDAFAAFKGKHDEETAELRRQVRDLENIQARMEAFGGIRSGQSSECPPELLAKWGQWARTGGTEFRNAVSVGTDPDGGFFVAPQITKEIDRLEQDVSPAEQLVRVVNPPEGSEWGQLMDIGGIASGWVGETAGRPETATSEIVKNTAPIGEIYANPRATQKELDDAGIDVGDWLTTGIGEEFAKQVGAAVVSGNGINKPRGFNTYLPVVTADDTRDWKVPQYIATGGASDFVAPTTTVSPADCLIDMVHALKPIYRRRAAWTMSSLTLARIRKFKDVDGRSVVAAGIQDGAPERLLGYPIVEFEDMPAIGAGTFPVAFADWKRAYVLVLRNIRILRDPYTAKPWVQFYSTRRSGGGLFNTQAIKFLKVAAS